MACHAPPAVAGGKAATGGEQTVFALGSRLDAVPALSAIMSVMGTEWVQQYLVEPPSDTDALEVFSRSVDPLDD